MGKIKDKEKQKHITVSPNSVLNDIVIYTPKRFKNTIDGLEAKPTPKLMTLIFIACIAVAIMFNFAFKLNYALWPFSILVALIFAPIIIIEILKEKSEHKKFVDINSYARQFINGMQLNRKILFAIENTLFTFPNGKMHDTLDNALKYISMSKNPKQSQVEALVYIDTMYPNTQTPMIHDFALRIENTGGNFEQEMELLNTKREKWEKRIEKEQQQTKTTLIGAAIMYFVMIGISLFIVAAMPESLDIMGFSWVQVAEMIVVCLLYPFIYACIRQYRLGWLKGEVLLNDEESEKTLDYLENYNPKKEQKKSLIVGISILALASVSYIFTRNIYLLIGLSVLGLIGFDTHSIKHHFILKTTKKEISRALPRWLFDVCLCLQKKSIVESITVSMKTAPPILKRDINRFLNKLQKKPDAIEPYLEFLADYEIPNVASTMRALLAITNGTGGNNNMQMKQLIEHNLNLLDDQEAADEEMRRVRNVKFNTFSAIPSTALMFVYFVAIIIKVFDTMGTMI